MEVWDSGFTGAPDSSQAWKYLPSRARCTPSSRASTVLGWVPAAMRTDFAFSTSPLVNLIDEAWPNSSTSMRSGVRFSRNTMPSSSAFSTSSWFRV
ncbi:hypothetical protein D3C83_110420 [compost metagenome]